MGKNYVSDFECSMAAGARWAGLKIFQKLALACTTVSRIYTERCIKQQKTSSDGQIYR